MKSLAYKFYVKTALLGDFHICISTFLMKDLRYVRGQAILRLLPINAAVLCLFHFTDL